MAKIDVKATVSAPSEINIPLVRADYHATSNIFRVFFEVFLAISSATLGAIQTMSEPLTIYWVGLGIFAVSGVIFLVCSLHFSKSSKNTS